MISWTKLCVHFKLTAFFTMTTGNPTSNNNNNNDNDIDDDFDDLLDWSTSDFNSSMEKDVDNEEPTSSVHATSSGR